MTPITSDLAGYALFWDRMFWRIAIGVVLALVPIYILLAMIWRKL